MNGISINEKTEIKDFIYSIYNESLTDISMDRKEGFTRTKFSFECDPFVGRETIDVSIYNFEDELVIKLWGDKIHREQLRKCNKIVMETVLPRWMPELYLSSTFIPISYPEWYQK